MADRLTQRDIVFLKKLKAKDRLTSRDMEKLTLAQKKIISRAKKFEQYSTIDPRLDKKDPLADLKAEERRKQKIKDMGSFNVGGLGRRAGRGLTGKRLAPAGLGVVGRSLSGKGFGLNEKLKKVKDRLKQDMQDLKEFKKKRKKIYDKPSIPLGKMEKKSGPKPGSMDYFLQETMKPGYKVPPMATGGSTFGKMLDKKFIKYAGSKQAQLHAKDFDEGLDRAERRAALETKQAYKKNKKTVKKLNTGGMCKGMGAAIRGGNFKGVK